VTDWVQLFGIAAFAAIGALFTAAVVAAQHGAGASLRAEAEKAAAELA
jgi:Tfp pilus assembly protein PilN